MKKYFLVLLVLFSAVCGLYADSDYDPFDKLAEKLLDGYNILIKDLSSKKGFENGQFIRLAVRNCQDNDRLIFALKEIFS